MKFPRVVLAALFGISLSPVIAHALQWEYLRSDDETRMILGAQGRIYARGQIDLKDAERLLGLISAHDISPESELVIDSPGGSVQGALDLGRAIRKHQLNTRIGRKDSEDWQKGVQEKARCLSACALAFLGGRFRFVEVGAEYGVHRFDAPPGKTNTIDQAQALSGSIISYLNEMKVSTELFALMARTPNETLRLLSPKEIQTLRIATGSMEEVRWNLSLHDGILHYTGNRNTVWGEQILDLECRPEGVRLNLFFESKNREEDLRQHSSRTVMIDDATHDIRKMGGSAPVFVGKYAVYSLKPPATLLDSLEKASELGFISRFSDETPLFLGFQGFPVAGQTEGIRAIRKCARGAPHAKP